MNYPQDDEVDAYIEARRGLDCDLCGEPFAKLGGPHDAGADGMLCSRCYNIDPSYY